jgi:hypothetical protein
VHGAIAALASFTPEHRRPPVDPETHLDNPN